MTVYIALLRGINVSGHKPVPMADLKTLFGKLGFKDAKTFIQSGNVAFSGGKSGAAALASAIEAGIADRFSFEVPVILRTLEEMRAIVAGNPFAKRKPAGDGRVYISYLDAAPSPAAGKALAAIPDENDAIVAKGREVYILTRIGYGKSLFSNTYLEKKLGVRSTTRNLETSAKLVTLGESL